MFFSTYVLTKKGPLAKIWLAAHWDKKLTKNEVRVIDLNQSVVQIVDPVVPIALRTSGELMVGVVRIYSLKVRHLLKDATDATVLLLRPKNVQLIKGKDKENAAAVTMDIVVARGGLGGADLAEADFGGIADILGGKISAAHAAKLAPGDEVIGTAWFTTEASQLLEDGGAAGAAAALGSTQDEIARIRADLLAAQQRGDSSSASSKSKSSLSSMEKGRASGQAVLGAGGVAADELLDIGAPAPLDIDFMMPAVDGGLGFDLADPFAAPPALGDFGFDGTTAVAAGAAPGEDAPPTKMARKLPKLLDANETTMSKEQFRRMVNDTHDIVNAERRHGPLDEQEARDRAIVRAGEQCVIDCQPLGDVVAPGLRAVYAAALRTSVAKAVERMEAARGTSGADQQLRLSGRGGEFLPDDGLLGPAIDGEMPPPDASLLAEYAAAPLPQEPAEEADEGRAGKRKRGQADGAGHQQRDGISASAIATLEKVRGLLKGKTERTAFSALGGGGSKPHQLMKRQLAARTFVDLLALASHGFVDVEQTRAFADIAIIRTSKLNEPVVAAAAH